MNKTTLILIVVVFVIIIAAILIFFYLKKKEEERQKAMMAQGATNNIVGGLINNASGLLGLWNLISPLFGGGSDAASGGTPFYPTPTGSLPRVQAPTVAAPEKALFYDPLKY